MTFDQRESQPQHALGENPLENIDKIFKPTVDQYQSQESGAQLR